MLRDTYARKDGQMAPGSINSTKAFSASMAETLQQSTKIMMNDLQQTVNRLDQKKENVAQAGLQRIQEANQTSQAMAENRQKIDIYV